MGALYLEKNPLMPMTGRWKQQGGLYAVIVGGFEELGCEFMRFQENCALVIVLSMVYTTNKTYIIVVLDIFFNIV